MQTLFLDAALDNFDAYIKASQVLASGGLVAFPTETVYGLGGDALSADAAARIYEAKGRPSDNPLIVHVADVASVDYLATNVSEKARLLMEEFWPGPLTIILQKSDVVPPATTGGLDTVAIRMPAHPVALKLIKESGVYIAAPSANVSGRPSPTTAEHVRDDLNGRIDVILDGGPVGIGIESTIVDMTGDMPMILRPGYITSKSMEAIIGPVKVDPALEIADSSQAPKAPGMKYTHYSPKGDLTIVEGKASDTVATINKLASQSSAQGLTVAVICDKATASSYICDNVLVAGTKSDDATIAAALYRILRQCDDIGADVIYSEAFAEGDLGYAIMNRLMKAAGQQIIHV